MKLFYLKCLNMALLTLNFNGLLLTSLTENSRSPVMADKQQVSCNGCLSELKSIDTGIPQGSNLGPLLFLIYSNDITAFCLIALLTLCR